MVQAGGFAAGIAGVAVAVTSLVKTFNSIRRRINHAFAI
jgi:hypothetical protein